MLTEQCAKLRKTAYEVECLKNDTIGMLTRDSLILADTAIQLREAADTIADLRGLLNEQTCELEINTDMTAVKCSRCGYVVPKGTNLMSVRYCAGCGRQVV
jgi:hypothetical protein